MCHSLATYILYQTHFRMSIYFLKSFSKHLTLSIICFNVLNHVYLVCDKYYFRLINGQMQHTNKPNIASKCSIITISHKRIAYCTIKKETTTKNRVVSSLKKHRNDCFGAFYISVGALMGIIIRHE